MIDLTARHIEILQLVSDGKQNKEISSLLSISVNTVKVHMQQILVRLEAQSRSHAVAIALRRQLIK